MKLSVIMPALNEEKNIFDDVTETLSAFNALDLDGEVIVINDGSTDRTSDIVRNIMKKDVRVKLINHDSPWGIGGSFWDGVKNSGGDAVTWLPGDNENDPLEALRYIHILEHVDIIVPFIYNRHVRSVFRNILSLIYRRIINTTFVTNLNYTNGTVIYRKSILSNLKIKSTGFFYQTDILIRLIKKGYLFAEVPCRLNQRKAGKSKAVSYPSLVKVVKGYFNLLKDTYLRNKSSRFCNRPLRGSLSAKRLIIDQFIKNKFKKEIYSDARILNSDKEK